MTDVQPYHHDDGTPWTSDELGDELRRRDLPGASGTKAEKLARLEADDAGEDYRGELEPAADEPEHEVSVADQWAVYQRADGSQYLVCLADVSEMADDQRPRTEPESPDDRRQAATVNP